MSYDPLHGDDQRNVRAEKILGNPAQGPLVLRVEAKDDIEPGGNGECYVVDYTGASLTKSTRKITVYDPLKILCACKPLSSENGDRFLVFWNADSRHYEPLGEFGLERPGVLTGSLAQGSTSTATLKKWNGAAMTSTAVSVDVYDWLLQTGADDILSGIQVELRYDRDRDKWRVIGAQCAA